MAQYVFSRRQGRPPVLKFWDGISLQTLKAPDPPMGVENPPFDWGNESAGSLLTAKVLLLHLTEGQCKDPVAQQHLLDWFVRKLPRRSVVRGEFRLVACAMEAVAAARALNELAARARRRGGRHESH